MKKGNKGITLIALVITIIIMLILVGVTVNYGIKSGLLSKAKGGTTEYKFKEEEDKIGEIRLAHKVDSETGKTNEDLIKYLGKELTGEASVERTSEGISIYFENSKNTHIIKERDKSTKNYILKDETKIKQEISDKGYVGYYADLDGNPETIEGIIYADLAVSVQDGQWGTDGGSYSYIARDKLNEYCISKEKFSEDPCNTRERNYK